MPGTKVTADFLRGFPSMKWTHIWHSPQLTPNSQVSGGSVSSHRMKGLRVRMDSNCFHWIICPIGSLVNCISSLGLPCMPSQVCASPFKLPLKSGVLWCEWGMDQPWVPPTLRLVAKWFLIPSRIYNLHSNQDDDDMIGIVLIKNISLNSQN